MHTDFHIQGILRDCHALHRGGLFKLERDEYKRRVKEVIQQDKNNETKMSIIIDGMDQSHSRIPYLGSQSSFGKKALTQHITGVKAHGKGIYIYRTLESVPKGANQTIYCILHQIEIWRDSHQGRYPEEIFIQVDGGGENANQWVLGMLELLATKRIVKTVSSSFFSLGFFR